MNKQTLRKMIFIFGASGHAKVVIDIIERQGLYEIAFLVDENPNLKGRVFFGYPVIGGKNELLELDERPVRGIVAIGNNQIRSEVAAWLTENGFELVSAIHPSAQVGRGASVGAGTVVMAGAVVNSDTCIGRNVIVNSRASIDHDCVICDGAHIAPGTTLCGTVTIGTGTFICAGVTVIPNLTIGGNAIVGAGSTVIMNIPDGVTAIGTPARIVVERG